MWVAALILYHREDEKSSLKLVTQLVTFLFRQSNIFKNCLWSHLSRFVFLLWDVKRDFIGILWIKLVWTWTITHPHVWVTSILNKNKTWQICILIVSISHWNNTGSSWKLDERPRCFWFAWYWWFSLWDRVRRGVQLSYVKTALNIKWTLDALKNNFKHWLVFFFCLCVC